MIRPRPNSGATFRLECLDWLDGQIHNNDDPSDVRDRDLTVAHVLSGQVAVQGADPGDLLFVGILDTAGIPAAFLCSDRRPGERNRGCAQCLLYAGNSGRHLRAADHEHCRRTFLRGGGMSGDQFLPNAEKV